MPFACLASVTYLFGNAYIVDICDSHQVVAASLAVFKQSPFPAHSQVFLCVCVCSPSAPSLSNVSLLFSMVYVATKGRTDAYGPCCHQKPC